MYKVEFYSTTGGQSSTRHRRITTAVICFEENVVAEESVTFHYKDLESKLNGQKYALTKALKFSNLSKDDRKAIWKDFFQRSKAAAKLISL